MTRVPQPYLVEVKGVKVVSLDDLFITHLIGTRIYGTYFSES